MKSLIKQMVAVARPKAPNPIKPPNRMRPRSLRLPKHRQILPKLNQQRAIQPKLTPLKTTKENLSPKKSAFRASNYLIWFKKKPALVAGFFACTTLGLLRIG